MSRDAHVHAGRVDLVLEEHRRRRDESVMAELLREEAERKRLADELAHRGEQLGMFGGEG